MRKRIALCLGLCLLAAACSACARTAVHASPAAAPTTAGELAYDGRDREACRLYLMENGRYAPFLVLDSREDGGALLLREYLLDELGIYNDEGCEDAYYADSAVDSFLNGEYLQTLSETTRALALTTSLEITSRRALEIRRPETEFIPRQVFLLSCEEICGGLGGLVAHEGERLDYFSTAQSKRACREDGSFDAWFLRTPVPSERFGIIGVSAGGTVGAGSTGSLLGPSRSGVRPALRIPADTPLIVREIDGRGVFTIE